MSSPLTPHHLCFRPDGPSGGDDLHKGPDQVWKRFVGGGFIILFLCEKL